VARTVRWTLAAAGDLEEIADFIRRDSAAYAASFVREALDAVRSLRRFAERGRLVPEIGDEFIREIFVHSYRLIYCVEKRTVFVLAFVHGARDLAALWQRREGSPLTRSVPPSHRPRKRTERLRANERSQ